MTDNNTALKKAGLKVTLPRLKILEVLQGPDNHHVSAEDLYKRLIWVKRLAWPPSTAY